MQPKQILFLVAAFASCMAAAAASGSPFFVGMEFSIGPTSGSSSETNGGAPWAGGGVVSDVQVGSSTMLGGHVGYRFNPNWAVSVGYQRSKADIRWNADFPNIWFKSHYAGSAISNQLIGNLLYAIPLSDPAATIHLSAGGGLAFNKLSNIVESTLETGVFLSDVADNSQTAPVGQLGAGLSYRLSPKVVLGLNGKLSYVGKFETGNTRSGNLGVTDINPYRIDNMWRKSIGVTLGVDL